MKKTEKKLVNTKDKVAGEVKEAVGKMTGNEELELKGKIQSTKADIKIKADEIKEDIADAANRVFDKKGKR